MGISEKFNCQCTAFESFARSHIFDCSDFLLASVPTFVMHLIPGLNQKEKKL